MPADWIFRNRIALAGETGFEFPQRLMRYSGLRRQYLKSWTENTVFALWHARDQALLRQRFFHFPDEFAHVNRFREYGVNAVFEKFIVFVGRRTIRCYDQYRNIGFTLVA